MRAAVVLFTRDLRLHDNPALTAALTQAETVLPLFVLDDGIRQTAYGGASNRLRFLTEALLDLHRSLRERGAGLVVRRGDVVAETVRAAREIGTTAVFAAADVSAYARRREDLLSAELDLRLCDGTFVVPPGAVTPAGGDHYRVFTPYHRAWERVPLGRALAAPRSVRLPAGVDASGPPLEKLGAVPAAPRGGESAALRRAGEWLQAGLENYGQGGHDDLAADATSRLSPSLHFGCISARWLALRARERGGDAYLRQLAWRDFYAQLLWANPGSQTADLRPRGGSWAEDPEGLDAWKAGETGYPLVDAGMRQLRAEGWMHNRARMVVASFLVKDLGVDWREGARHFFNLLLDGDIAQNVGNWQWVAGTGVDTRPNRVYNPTAQAKKLDPDGSYIRRHVAELADVPAPLVLQPGVPVPGYPEPIVDHAAAVEAFLRRRGVRTSG